MKMGFSGTRNGMTEAQKNAFVRLIDAEPPNWFHHGSCVGADCEAALIVRMRFPVYCVIVRHPPKDTSLMAQNAPYGEDRPAKSHLARNRDIVNETELLIATPFQMEHQESGGTWYTIDFAKKKKKKVTIIYPDGTLEESK